MASLADLLHSVHLSDHPYAGRCDDRLVISLVLALASGHRNLVLRVQPSHVHGARDEQRAQRRRQRHDSVQRAADEVAWICAVVFALSSHRVPCSSKLSATAFLKALFAPPPPANPGGNVSPSRKSSFASRASVDGQRRTPKRSMTGPLEVSVARANEAVAVDLEGRRARSPSRVSTSSARPPRPTRSSQRVLPPRASPSQTRQAPSPMMASRPPARTCTRPCLAAGPSPPASAAGARSARGSRAPPRGRQVPNAGSAAEAAPLRERGGTRSARGTSSARSATQRRRSGSGSTPRRRRPPRRRSVRRAPARAKRAGTLRSARRDRAR
ncbi:hypothetical protein DMC30DRAFT_271480 [Rhodotorula diobovata]|uniref:Uncharacterized protein n=1 Tax=Rhodotorula diobovata TaxID=5288 RepID=A0A5C5FTA2_9BASI|nr:hypothetical protein DMC30DRAFT_271480 [Rhodotorula diobovata]